LEKHLETEYLEHRDVAGGYAGRSLTFVRFQELRGFKSMRCNIEAGEFLLFDK